MADFAKLRGQMVDIQIARRGVRDEGVLAAMREVPRERFVPDAMQEFAYEDSPLPIEEGQTISQPYIVGLMLEAGEIGGQDRVLEIGAGSGYAAAVASRLAAQVCAVERIGALAQAARERLARLGYDNVEVLQGDGTEGWPARRIFDVILVAAAGPEVPQALVAQLAQDGRLVMPVGPRSGPQRLVRLRRTPEGLRQDDWGAVAFVPLIGAEGFAEDK